VRFCRPIATPECGRFGSGDGHGLERSNETVNSLVVGLGQSFPAVDAASQKADYFECRLEFKFRRGLLSFLTHNSSLSRFVRIRTILVSFCLSLRD
jgi:hypothetical protein